MKVQIVFELEAASDASMGEVGAVVHQAATSFAVAVGPVGKCSSPRLLSEYESGACIVPVADASNPAPMKKQRRAST